ncbi:MAG: GAF domain-containing SpoIIE family protein phosphatase [Thermodesulfovibrionales bacterium]|jgi:sigma-B regulation protein RsbU (phosphoserine phosphatase)
MDNNAETTVQQTYLKNLEKKVEDLRILTEVSATISSTLDMKELMTLVMEKAKSVMDAEACSILLYNRDTGKLEFEVALCNEGEASDLLKKKITLDIGQGIAGWVAENRELLIIRDVKSDKRFFQDADKLTGFETRNLIAAPLIGRRGLIGVAELINLKREDYDLELIRMLTKQFAIAIENALYHTESLEKERLKQELEIAATLQRSFLPESPVFRKGNIMTAAVNIPAKQVGGDLYDFIEPVDGKVGVFIGDVSGKGVSAALYMAKIISDFRYLAHEVNSPETVMDRLNTVLSRTPRGMFLTAIYMIIDTVKCDLKVSVAGHPPFLWITGKKVKVTSLPAGPPLGIIPEDYPVSRLSLNKGDRLILLTDGVFEAKNRDGGRIGFDAVVDFVRKHAADENIIDKLTDHVNEFSKGVEQTDDLTIVEVRSL